VLDVAVAEVTVAVSVIVFIPVSSRQDSSLPLFGGIAASGRPTKFMLAGNRGDGFHLGFAARPHVISLEVDES
jgi:hypothetical protein